MLLTRSSDHSTISLTRNAKGETQIDVNIRAGENAEFPTVDAATEKAAELYDLLRERYPLSPTGDDAGVTLTRNAKGETQMTVEVKTAGPNGALTLRDVMVEAGEVYEKLRARFPTLTGAVGS
jgi:hypothetical protein